LLGVGQISLLGWGLVLLLVLLLPKLELLVVEVLLLVLAAEWKGLLGGGRDREVEEGVSAPSDCARRVGGSHKLAEVKARLLVVLRGGGRRYFRGRRYGGSRRGDRQVELEGRHGPILRQSLDALGIALLGPERDPAVGLAVLPAHARVIAVLDGEVAPSGEHGASNLRPLVAHRVDGLEELGVLLLRPLLLVQIGTQVVAPPVAALLADPTRKVRVGVEKLELVGDPGPGALAVAVDQFPQEVVLALAPLGRGVLAIGI
jgi:hypothetical protein